MITIWKWAVLQGKPHSVEDALKLALEYEAFQKGRCGRYGDALPFCTQGQDLTSDINGGKSQTSGNQNRGSNGNGKRKQCTFCKRLGHVEKDCYQKKNLQMLVTGPVTSVIPQNTLLGTVKQGAATYRITQAIKGE